MRNGLLSCIAFMTFCSASSCAHFGGSGSSADDCPSDLSLKVDTPNELWVLKTVDGPLKNDGWCSHYTFTHTSRTASIGIGILPWDKGAPALAREYAKDLTEYDNNTGEGDIMDRDEDGESWAFLYVLRRSESGNDLYFMSFLKDPRKLDIIIVVTGLWPQNDNIGLLHQLTLFTDNISIVDQ